MRYTRELLEIAGIGRERLRVAWISSAEAQRFAQIATEITETIKTLGPLDIQGLALELAAAEKSVDGETLRWLVGKEIRITTKGDVYGRPWDVPSYEQVLDQALLRDFRKNLIQLAIREGHVSVRAISARTNLKLQLISNLLCDMEKTGMIAFTGMREKKPVFAAL